MQILRMPIVLNKSKITFLPYLGFATLIYLSWAWPGSIQGAVLAIISCLLLAWHSNTQFQLSVRKLYISGIVVNFLGFYWLAQTIEKFGGFNPILSYLIFGLFVLLSSLQFLLFAFLFNNLPRALGHFRLAFAWVSAEFLFPRIFPWEISHPLIGIPALAQIADIAGTPFLSFVLLTQSAIATSCFSLKKKNSYATNAMLFISVMITWLTYGTLSQSIFTRETTGPLKVAIVQANVSIIQQGDITSIQQNKQRYLSLSRDIETDTDLIIWPESVIQDWIWVDTKNVDQDPRLPYFGPHTSLLSGALTFRSQDQIYNSALLISNTGDISSPYHKRILMPFGEYMPFSEIFPWLNSINANLALFTAGDSVRVFSIESSEPLNTPTLISPLICYEDLIPRLSRSATQNGAEILINLTNDVWFGDGPAAAHHNLIASFRAIENRRYLVRSTNNGFTTVINPLGKIVGFIPEKSEGILKTNIEPQQYQTLFTLYFGPYLWWSISLSIFLIAVFSKLTQKFKKNK